MRRSLIADLKKLACPERARFLAGFFRTGKGQYGEGDVFLGVTVPEQRKIARRYRELPLKDIGKLLSSRIHEQRLTALLILIEQFEKADKDKRHMIFELYMQSLQGINSWDLVDVSAGKIVGAYLFDKDRSLLYALARSDDLWKKRIAIMATFHFIRHYQFKDSLNISEILLYDEHDLIHKAAGWMLREIGKRDQGVAEDFLSRYCSVMPRTMLRYAIERFDEKKRKSWLAK